MAYTVLNVSPALVHEAQLGNKVSLEQLTTAARGRVFAYIYRLTLDYQLTEDLTQDTLLTVVSSISQLENADKFWAWVLRTALGKVQHHWREMKRKRAFEELSEHQKHLIAERLSGQFEDGLSEMLRKELSGAVFKAIRRLKFKYRTVLVLRCYEQLSYAEIGNILQCSELQSRVMFFRAKGKLKRQLALQGFGRRYFMLGLALFGFVTACGKTAYASTTIAAGTLEVGFWPAVMASICSKMGVLVAAGAGVLAVVLPLKTFVVVLAAGFVLFVLLLILSLLTIYS
jgi:RNA polymerase sigma-70 factor (ECF subfamily)